MELDEHTHLPSQGGQAKADVCPRCGGLMLVEHYIDLQDDTGQIGITAWRCSNCGEVLDPTILHNRMRPAPNLLYGTKQRKYAQRLGPANAGPSEGRRETENGSADQPG